MGFTVQSIGANEKNIGLAVKNIGTNNKNIGFSFLTKHKNQQQQIGFTLQIIGTNEKDSFYAKSKGTTEITLALQLKT